jgi:hypothetical protein
VVRLPVVARQLLPGLDPASRIEFDAPPIPPHVRVRLTRMVDVPEVAPAARGVEGRPVPELDDHDAVGSARTPPGFALSDGLPAEFAQLPPGGDGREREDTAALDAAPPHCKVESIQAREL